MKVLILVLTLSLGISLRVLSQEIDSLSQREALLELSQKQKKTGFILVGVGLATAIGGGFLALSSESNSSGETLGAGMFVLGVGSMVGGLAMWVISSSNQDRAKELSLGITPIDLPKGTYFGPPAIPNLTLTIPLKGRK